MPMAMMVQDDKGSQSFILASMNLEQECFDYFTQDLLEDNFKSWQKVSGDPQKPHCSKSKRLQCAKFDDFQVKEIQENLGAECPIFVKSMLPTNVTRGFFLTLPQQFCNLHLPLHDTIVTLEDESGEEYRLNFLVGHRILSGGWRRFSIANKLVVGDLLVFRLVRPLKFKVYRLGTRSLAEANTAFSLLKLGACTKQTLFDSRLSKQQRKNYFDLCCSQSSFLHDHLLKSLNGKLAAEIIIETTNIANAIGAGEIFTPHGDYAMLEKTLVAFEMLGMNVRLLRAQLRQLLSLSFKSKQAKLEQACAKEEMRTALESKYLELKDRMVIVDSKIEALKEVVKTRELFFQEEADAPSPW
ncbi:hypothetical protein M0R45_007823 [Rubus argutus]|uniref:TF-B3 domain-containing protein n=1 Tax=Rubus argutus TaxID=59490 RepID=A0AAW1XYX7_RUBAR